MLLRVFEMKNHNNFLGQMRFISIHRLLSDIRCNELNCNPKLKHFDWLKHESNRETADANRTTVGAIFAWSTFFPIHFAVAIAIAAVLL